MKKIIVILLILFFSVLSYAQSDHGMGLEFDYDEAVRVPRQAQMLTRGYDRLPSSVSLRQYCPTPQSQGRYSTCTAWATTYAAMTIAYAVANNWSRSQIDSETFAPWYTYYMIKDKSNPLSTNCKLGTYISRAGNLMLNVGVPKKRDYDTECASYAPGNNYRKYKIDCFKSLFVAHPQMVSTIDNANIQSIKMALANSHPVIIGARSFPSIHQAKERWIVGNETCSSYHAMCIVGYDDYKFGGAFLIQNSWGTWWGDGGYTWLTYNDCKKAVYEAYEIYVKPQSYNISRPNSLSGTLRLQLSTGEEMHGTLGTNGVYKISGEYISGTRYRIYISNNEPAYVYVIGSDLQNNVSKVFPPNDRISPALTYKSNNIAIPDENWFVQMDNTVGKDYVCVLYSAQDLDINTIISKIRSGYGSFPEKVSAALSGKIVPASDVRFSQNSISFSASTNKSVVALIAEVVHK